MRTISTVTGLRVNCVGLKLLSFACNRACNRQPYKSQNGFPVDVADASESIYGGASVKIRGDSYRAISRK